MLQVGRTVKCNQDVCEPILFSICAWITMSIKTGRHQYSSHIDIRWHYIRELCLSGVVKLIALRTHHMVADTLTKILAAPGLTRHGSVLMGHSTFHARILRIISGRQTMWVLRVAQQAVAQQYSFMPISHAESDDLRDNESSVISERAFRVEVYSLYVYSTPLCGSWWELIK